MNGLWSNASARTAWQEEKPPATESYKQGVAGISAQIILWSGEALNASFYLRLTSSTRAGRETLGERLNDPGTRFIPCKIDDQVELLGLDWISYIRVTGISPDVALREQAGARRRSARLIMQSGYVLEGQLVHELPEAHARVSDLVNRTSDRFLLFQAPAALLYVNRSAIVRIFP